LGAPTSNALLVYNPRNWQYYKLYKYRINPYTASLHLYMPTSNATVVFSATCSETTIPHMEEKYPPSACVERLDPSTNVFLSSTVVDILFPATFSSPDSLSTDLNYTILFGNGTTYSILLQEITLLIPFSPVGLLLGDSSSSQYSLLPPFLRINSKITYE
jgi:hypothetical protein